MTYTVENIRKREKKMCSLLGVMENPPWTLHATLTGREDVKPSTQCVTDLHGPST